MMLYGQELDTPLFLITQPSCDGMDEPVCLTQRLLEPPSKKLTAMQEQHPTTVTTDKNTTMTCPAYFAVGDLVRTKTHPRSDA